MVNGAPYCPKRGDLVWMVFDPRVDHEQSGLRPAMVVSPTVYNERTGLCIVVPVTSNAKGYPFEVLLPEGQPVVGVILVDHIRSVDWRARQCRFLSEGPSDVWNEVRAKLELLLS